MRVGRMVGDEAREVGGPSKWEPLEVSEQRSGII